MQLCRCGHGACHHLLQAAQNKVGVSKAQRCLLQLFVCIRNVRAAGCATFCTSKKTWVGWGSGWIKSTSNASVVLNSLRDAQRLAAQAGTALHEGREVVQALKRAECICMGKVGYLCPGYCRARRTYRYPDEATCNATKLTYQMSTLWNKSIILYKRHHKPTLITTFWTTHESCNMTPSNSTYATQNRRLHACTHMNSIHYADTSILQLLNMCCYQLHGEGCWLVSLSYVLCSLYAYRLSLPASNFTQIHERVRTI